MDPPGSSPRRSVANKLKQQIQHRSKNAHQPPRCFIEQMDGPLALQALTQIQEAPVSFHDEEHVKRLEGFAVNHAGVSTALSRLRSSNDTGYDRLNGILNQRRKDVYLEKVLARRLKRRAAIQEQIRTLKKSISERAASSADDERGKLWRQIVRKHIPKAAKQLTSSYSNRLLNAKRTAGFCSRETKKLWTRQGRLAKDSSLRARKQMREMLLFWRKNEREEREARKRAEKEAAEAKRQEEEQREAKRQAKKLNFLLAQTELFAHFVANKDDASAIPQIKKLEAGVDLAEVDDAEIRAHAAHVAHQAAQRNREQRKAFDQVDFSKQDVSQAVSQPRMLQAQLKGYQLHGLSWLAGLWEQGINGILADEMGLGKTIQAISLLAHLAEAHGIWGPFIVVAPASTLHNWQQELARFVPSLRILPYWGTASDRKSLRKFWPSSSSAWTRDSTFHIMVTSYQLVVSDASFLGRIRWQYMVLDEAQAIKSSASQRWSVLLGFACRNRLLLTGTPIQNSMQELWALLHFIMPTLFDSHDEFSAWFAKDIETAAASETGTSARGNMAAFDQHQLARLHAILKPFMLRRVKKDVQSELPPKHELDISCPLAPKQRRFYRAIKQKLPIAELMKSMNSDAEASASLMNVLMQLRKVCNHPELFEREPVVSPLVLSKALGLSEFKGSVLAWPGPLPALLDLSLPKLVDCVEADLINLKIEHAKVPSIEIKLAEPFEELVPTSIRFLQERLPRAYTPAAVAPSPFKLSSQYATLPVDNCAPDYSCGQHILVPDPMQRIKDCGKLAKLDELLIELEAGGHRVLIYNQMTRMIDLLEEYLQYRKYRYLRLDGSTKIADRRDMVNDWQSQPDIFVFLLSTRAGGLGINLTAADTVIFYDSDWNPTVDQQAMDRAHRLGQTRPVTVYRMVTSNSVEERIRQRALQKGIVHNVVIAGGDFEQQQAQPTTQEKCDGPMKARELASLLLDDS